MKAKYVSFRRAHQLYAKLYTLTYVLTKLAVGFLATAEPLCESSFVLVIDVIVDLVLMLPT